ncbi:MAG: DUF1810 domain-containing protein [Pseudomonadota bacterium]
MEDPFNLSRFVNAQAGVIGQVQAELGAGQKASHWMWFIFPQLRDLGRSQTAKFYGLSGAEEAAAYLAHPALGAALLECTRLMIAARPASAEQILGNIDALKFRSSMTLFAALPGADPVFQQALDAFYDGPDPQTLALLAGG